MSFNLVLSGIFHTVSLRFGVLWRKIIYHLKNKENQQKKSELLLNILQLGSLSSPLPLSSELSAALFFHTTLVTQRLGNTAALSFLPDHWSSFAHFEAVTFLTFLEGVRQ